MKKQLAKALKKMSNKSVEMAILWPMSKPVQNFQPTPPAKAFDVFKK